MPAFLTSFVGRERELADLSRLVPRCRLVTLTGPPGAGKSRLAAEAVRGWRRRFREHSWMDLAGVEDPKSLAPLLADALAIRSPVGDKLLSQMAGPRDNRRALLILDSCEHVAAACARVVARLILLLPSLHVLATSQEPLGIGGECLFHLSPLDSEAAVRLFVERAEARQHGFTAAGHSRRDIATLCRHLDNLPLAIELAAGRSPLMTPGEMLSHLNERFEVLVGSSREGPVHHRTLQASIESSYRLLEPEDRPLLNRLSICAGSFDLPIASALTGQSAIDGVGRLVDRSLVVATRERGVTRYRLLESIREFALRRLAEDGAPEDVRSRLHEHLLAEVEAGYERRMRDGSDELLILLADNRENLHALLDQLEPTDGTAALRLAGAMREDMALRTPLEGRQRLARLIGADPPRDRWLARGLLALGHVEMVLGNVAEADQALLESSAISREIGDLLGEAWALYFAGNTDSLGGEAASGQRYLTEALDLFGRANSPYGLVRVRTSVGMALVIQGEDLERARRLLEDGSRTGERLGNRWSVGIAAVYLGLLELRLGRLKEAAAHWRHALTPLAELGDHALLTPPFCGLGRALVHTDARRALTLVAFAVEMRARIGGRFPPAWVELVDQTRGQGERLLGKTAAESAWQRGLRLSVADAIRLAQGQEVAGAAAGPLSRREREVAELIADGLSNRVVSHRLHISERTVEGHVLHILNKLGLENRTQVAAWLRRSGTGTSTG